MRFSRFCINRPVFTIVLSLIIMAVGLIGYLRVPVRGYPDVNRPVISVTTNYDGASAQSGPRSNYSAQKYPSTSVGQLQNLHGEIDLEADDLTFQ